MKEFFSYLGINTGYDEAKWFHKPFRKILCLFLGHHYLPHHEETVTTYRARSARRRKWTRMKRVRARYTCECCGARTKWLNPDLHRAFQKKYCPTWGGRGSDSQGYKNENADS